MPGFRGAAAPHPGGPGRGPRGRFGPLPVPVALATLRASAVCGPASGRLLGRAPATGRPSPFSPGRPIGRSAGPPVARAGVAPRPPSLRLGAALRRGRGSAVCPPVGCVPPCVGWAALAPLWASLAPFRPPVGSPLPVRAGAVGPLRRLRRPRASPHWGRLGGPLGRLYHPPPPWGSETQTRTLVLVSHSKRGCQGINPLTTSFERDILSSPGSYSTNRRPSVTYCGSPPRVSVKGGFFMPFGNLGRFWSHCTHRVSLGSPIPLRPLPEGRGNAGFVPRCGGTWVPLWCVPLRSTKPVLFC